MFRRVFILKYLQELIFLLTTCLLTSIVTLVVVAVLVVVIVMKTLIPKKEYRLLNLIRFGPCDPNIYEEKIVGKTFQFNFAFNVALFLFIR